MAVLSADKLFRTMAQCAVERENHGYRVPVRVFDKVVNFVCSLDTLTASSYGDR